MPKKRITFIVIPANDGQVREYRFAPTHLRLGVLAAVASTRSVTVWFREMKSEFAMAIPVSSLAMAWSIGRRYWA